MISIRQKRLIYFLLCVAFAGYTILVYFSDLSKRAGIDADPQAAQGKLYFQKYNCVACHQLYGLGGYMGPDLTNVMSAQGKGEDYARAFLKNGTNRMPDFRLKEEEIAALVSYLKYVDQTGVSPVRHFKLNPDGTVTYQD